MIPAFLHSIAAQVRALVASGKALHVNEDTAAELELIAGLDWGHAPMPVLNEVVTRSIGSDVEREVTVKKVTPADFAWAWLRLVRTGSIWNGPHAIVDGKLFNESTRRAAECAELAVLCAETIAIGTDGHWSGTEVHRGTREGARAAWMHIANQLQPTLRPIIKASLGCVGVRDANPENTQMGNRYRRELEAM